MSIHGELGRGGYPAYWASLPHRQGFLTVSHRQGQPVHQGQGLGASSALSLSQPPQLSGPRSPHQPSGHTHPGYQTPSTLTRMFCKEQSDMHIVPSLFTSPFKRRATAPCQPGARQGTQVWATDSASLPILPPAPSADSFLPPEEPKPNSSEGLRGAPTVPGLWKTTARGCPAQLPGDKPGSSCRQEGRSSHQTWRGAGWVSLKRPHSGRGTCGLGSQTSRWPESLGAVPGHATPRSPAYTGAHKPGGPAGPCPIPTSVRARLSTSVCHTR